MNKMGFPRISLQPSHLARLQYGAIGLLVAIAAWLALGVFFPEYRDEADPALMRALNAAALLLGILLLFVSRRLDREKAEQARLRFETEMRDSEERFRQISAAAQDAIILMDPEGRVAFWNRAAETMFGYDAQQAAGRELHDLIIPQRYRERHIEGLRRFVETGTGAAVGKVLEVFGRRKDGSEFPIELAISALRLGNKWHAAAMLRDISARKKAEQALQLSEDRYRDLVEHSHNLMCTHDLDGNILSVNTAPAKSLGYTVEEMQRMNLRDILANSVREGYEDYIATIKREGFAKGMMLVQTRTGERRVWEYANTLRADAFPAPIVRGIGRDITEQKRTEEALRERESRYRTVVETSTDGFWVLDKDGRILDVNQRYVERSGYTREQLLGMTLFDIERSHPPDTIRRNLAMVEHSHARIIEGLHLAKDGSLWPVEVSTLHLPDDGGRFFSFLRDITERKRLTEARLRSQKLESLGTLAGGIAHDFNNIITAIHGNAMLAATDLDKHHPATVSLAEISKAAKRASELVRRIMAFGRPQPPKREVANLGAVMDEVLQLLRPTLPASIALETHIDRAAPPVMADAAQIHEILMNLTTNAAYAIGRQPGSIRYALEAVEVGVAEAQRFDLVPGPYAKLTVADTGCGMDEATKSRIFDAFYTTKPVGEGTGLGLSVVYGLVQRHGGTITADSAPGRGSSFELYFPAAKEEQLPETRVRAREAKPAQGMRVMYVDDEEPLVSLAMRGLARFGHVVSGFVDPKAALAQFQAHPGQFDVVVTDLSMPEMSGVELASRLLAIRADIPVLMMTGYGSIEDEAGARKAGVREVIFKPVDIDELAKMLDRVASRAAPNAEERIA